MAAALLLLIIIYAQPSTGCPDHVVLQSGEITVQRGACLKLNCTFNATLQDKKPSLKWTRKKGNKEVTIYPEQSASDKARFHMDPEAFKNQADAGLIMKDLTGRDSGLYLCRITVLEDGGQKEYRINGIYLNVQGTLYDTLIACCPLGVFIAALLVLHGMVYKQWREHKKLGGSNAEKRTWRIGIPKFFSDFFELFSAP
ncbi:uncharacterized protein LOC143923698 [Lithobates pipiens]